MKENDQLKQANSSLKKQISQNPEDEKINDYSDLIDIKKLANAKKIAERLHKQTLQFIEERRAWDVEEEKRRKANNYPRL